MKKEAQLFKSLADETRLKMLWLLMGREELCVCDIMGVLGTTQSKASRHLRYLYHLGWVTDRREGVWMNYRLSVAPGSPEDKQLKLLADIFSSQPGGPGAYGTDWSNGWRPRGRARTAPPRANAPELIFQVFFKPVFYLDLPGYPVIK